MAAPTTGTGAPPRLVVLLFATLLASAAGSWFEARAPGTGARIIVPDSWQAAAAAAPAMARSVAEAAGAAPPFVARCGNNLCVPSANGTTPLRMAGSNIYWLGLDENVPPGTIAYPTPFRIWDALTTAASVMGATVVRSHTLGISTGNPLSFEPALGVFNATALAAADYAIYVARQLGLRLQIPLTDNWDYYHGSYHNFCTWLGAPPTAFYTNATVIGAFEDYVRARLAHVNAFTGVPASDDPTIMMWETGNELTAPAPWTATIAAVLKASAPSQLVMDGNFGINPAALPLPAVDAYSDHFYPPDTARLAADIALVQPAGKLFVVGEFGWPVAATPAFLAAIEAAHAGVAYDAWWSLFGHDDGWGFVQHGDGFTLHWPGDTPAMAANATLLRSHAYTMAGVAPIPPAATIPAAPLITLLNASTAGGSNGSIAWRGTPGGALYSIASSTAGPAGPFVPLCLQCATDNDTPLSVALPPTSAWLQVQPVNVAGAPGPTSASNETSTAPAPHRDGGG